MPTQRTLQTGLLVAAAVITLVIAFQQQHRAAVNLRDRPVNQFNDFNRWMVMTPTFVHEHADYVDDQLPTPPISLLVLGPLSALGRANSQFAWVCLKLPMVCLTWALAVGLVRRSGGQLTSVAMALVVAGWWLPVIIDLQEGQTNFLAALPLVAGLLVAQTETTASSIAAGVLIALGIAMKVTPIVFAPYFLWRRRFVVVAAVAVGLAFWSFVVPALAFGWDQNLRWLDEWATIMIVPYVTHGKVVYSTSQSVGSFALRLLTAMPAFESHYGDVIVPRYMNVMSLSVATVLRVLRVATIGVALAGLWWMRRPLETLKQPRYVIEVGAVSAFMLWFSERTWGPHYVSFLLMLVAAGMTLSDRAQSVGRRDRVRVALVAFAASTLFASDLGRLFGPDSINWIRAAGIFLWPSVVVTAVTLWASTSTSPSIVRHEDTKITKVTKVTKNLLYRKYFVRFVAFVTS